MDEVRPATEPDDDAGGRVLIVDGQVDLGSRHRSKELVFPDGLHNPGDAFGCLIANGSHEGRVKIVRDLPSLHDDLDAGGQDGESGTDGIGS
jgi:hypothetical protein